MEKQDYTTVIAVNAPAQDAFESINKVSGWWTENMEGSSQRLNDVFTVIFGTTWKTFKITESVPGKKVVWQVIDCCLPWNKNTTEWTGTSIIFEISESGEDTEIRFTHLGLDPEAECFSACSNAWGQYIQQSLRSLIVSGKGNPDPKKSKTKA